MGAKKSMLHARSESLADGIPSADDELDNEFDTDSQSEDE